MYRLLLLIFKINFYLFIIIILRDLSEEHIMNKGKKILIVPYTVLKEKSKTLKTLGSDKKALK